MCVFEKRATAKRDGTPNVGDNIASALGHGRGKDDGDFYELRVSRGRKCWSWFHESSVRPILVCPSFFRPRPTSLPKDECLQTELYVRSTLLHRRRRGIRKCTDKRAILSFKCLDAGGPVALHLDGVVVGEPIDLDIGWRAILVGVQLGNQVLVSGNARTLAGVGKRCCGATKGGILRSDLEDINHVAAAVSIGFWLCDGQSCNTNLDVLATTRCRASLSR